MQGSFTYGKELSLGSNSDTAYLTAGCDQGSTMYSTAITNKQLSPFSQPFRVVISGNLHYAKNSRRRHRHAGRFTHYCETGSWVRVLQYQSGALIQVPCSNNQLFAQLNRGVAGFPAALHIL